MADVRLRTYQDTVERLSDTFGITHTPVNLRLLKRAIFDAQQELPQATQWEYYQKRMTFASEKSLNGVGNYIHTGDVVERAFRIDTNVSPAFPANSARYRIMLDPPQGRAHYPIQLTYDEDLIQLPISQNPGQDVSNASYTIYRSQYPLPTDFQRVGPLFDFTGKFQVDHVDVDNHHALGIFFDTPSTPERFTVRNATEYYNVSQIELGPPPRNARNYDFMYERMPRELRVLRVSQGTVTLDPGGIQLAFSDPVLREYMVGSVIRFSTDATEPDDFHGGWRDATDPSANFDNPYFAERIIQSVRDAQSAFIDQPVSETGLTNVGFVITDPLDLNTATMYNAFIALCELKFSEATARADVDRRRGKYLEQLRAAMSADSMARESAQAGNRAGRAPFHMRGWSSIPDEIVHPSI